MPYFTIRCSSQSFFRCWLHLKPTMEFVYSMQCKMSIKNIKLIILKTVTIVNSHLFMIKIGYITIETNKIFYQFWSWFFLTKIIICRNSLYFNITTLYFNIVETLSENFITVRFTKNNINSLSIYLLPWDLSAYFQSIELRLLKITIFIEETFSLIVQTIYRYNLIRLSWINLWKLRAFWLSVIHLCKQLDSDSMSRPQ